jgi:bifunctional non-homologous end joining protein LigD
MDKPTITVDGHTIELSKTEKVLFPEPGLTKGDLIDYYRRIAPTMLPHIEERALSFQRFPDGIETQGFFQKNASDHFPDWIGRARLSKEDGEVEHVVARDAATLVYLANQACITLHVGLAVVARPRHPDRLVIDLDPSGEEFAKVKQAARWAKDLLEELDLVGFLQTTGSRGLHVWVPLDGSAGFEEVSTFAKSFASTLEQRQPDALTTEQRKANRGDRVFLDVLRNAYGQTAVAPFSVRARPLAPVATPIDWAELDGSQLAPDHYTITNIFRRLGQKHDPWADVAKRARGLGAASARLAELRASA